MNLRWCATNPWPPAYSSVDSVASRRPSASGRTVSSPARRRFFARGGLNEYLTIFTRAIANQNGYVGLCYPPALAHVFRSWTAHPTTRGYQAKTQSCATPVGAGAYHVQASSAGWLRCSARRPGALAHARVENYDAGWVGMMLGLGLQKMEGTRLRGCHNGVLGMASASGGRPRYDLIALKRCPPGLLAAMSSGSGQLLIPG